MFYTLRFFGGRHPLCGSGVTSTISDTSIPLAWIARIADSRPLPGPLTYTFAFLIPRSNATFAQSVSCLVRDGNNDVIKRRMNVRLSNGFYFN